MSAGPFDVVSEQVAGLGTAFTEFVNRLLALEASRAEMLSHDLRTTSRESVADGGVDAETRRSAGSRWIPEGDAAWQFKRSNLQPAECSAELLGARWALELLRSGAAYRLVLGVPLTAEQVELRRIAIEGAARELGVDVRPGTIEVLDANAVARWASEFPSLAVSRIVRGTGSLLVEFDQWERSESHQLSWYETSAQREIMSRVQNGVQDASVRHVRVQGVSGAGKTRAVMEAFRASPYRELVAYAASEQHASAELRYLVSADRAAILVVDECTARDHAKLIESLPYDTSVRIVSIGPAEPYPMRSPSLTLDSVSEADLQQVIDANYMALSDEARRFVVRNSGGNLGFAVVLASRLQTTTAAHAADLLREADLEALVRDLIPEGRAFLAAARLALFERVGFDGELAGELATVANYAGTNDDELRQVASDLEHRGLLTKHGRYRSLSPHPVAVVLAAHAWDTDGGRIVRELLPTLSPPMLERLLRRASDLGSYPPARTSLVELMSADGPLGSLAAIEISDLGKLLTALGIVAPDETAGHLGALIAHASRDELLSQTRSRRDLVWCLEKLAWHSRTFEVSADALLALASAENESWANNATGSWTALFGAALPATAATSGQRLAYLRRKSESEDPGTRSLLIRALERATQYQETVGVSGELQAGELVEPRGGARTIDEAYAYKREAIEILRELANDPNEEVSNAAAKELLDLLRHADDPRLGTRISDAVIGLPERHMRRVRTEIESLLGWTGRSPHDRLAEALRGLQAQLVRGDARDDLLVLLELDPWVYEADEFRGRFEALLADVSDDARPELVEAVLGADPRPSAWHFGAALAGRPSASVKGALLRSRGTNLVAAGGYLSRLTSEGPDSAFDRTIDEEWASELAPFEALALTVRGPATPAARSRIVRLAGQLPTADSAREIRWWRELAENESAALLEAWLARLSDDADYEAVVDWAAMWLHAHPEATTGIADLMWTLVEARRRFPLLRTERHDWGTMAHAVLRGREAAVVNLVLDLVTEHELVLIASDAEAQVLASAVRSSPADVWPRIGARLEAHQWRVTMTIRGWLMESVPLGAIEEWVGDSVERGRLVASVAPAGTTQPTPYAIFLLDVFAGDEEIERSLSGEYVSGSWTGSWSSQLDRQASTLRVWAEEADYPPGLRAWAQRLSVSLENERQAVLEREAEED